MYYMLNNEVKFRPEDGAIWVGDLSDENEPLVLTLTERRLFLLLLEEQGHVLTRNDIFHRVWECWGLEGSNNSLNHFISRLRKVLDIFGLPETTIQTVPRIGFMLSSDLDIQQVKLKHPIPSDKTPHPFFQSYISIFFLMLSIMASAIIYFYPVSSASHQNATEYIGGIQQCSIYSLISPLDLDKALLMHNAAKLIVDNKLSCEQKSTVFFYLDKTSIFYNGGKIFIAFCAEGNDDINNCINIMDRNWKGIK